MIETTVLGAALAAGFAVGVWSMNCVKSITDTFIPTTTQDGRFKNKFHFINLILKY